MVRIRRLATSMGPILVAEGKKPLGHARLHGRGGAGLFLAQCPARRARDELKARATAQTWILGGIRGSIEA
jgi:hypothetical protein